MIDPKNVYVAIPCADGRLMAETAAALIRIGNRFNQFSFPSECSHVGLVRDHIADMFLKSDKEWLVSIDSDIYFTPQDWDLLMEPCAAGAVYPESTDQPTPSRTTTALVVGRDPKTGKPLHAKGAADLAVCAEYSFKNEQQGMVKLGMGFVRIHRTVFETLRTLKHVGGRIDVTRELWARLMDTDSDFALNALNELLKLTPDFDAPRIATMNWKGSLVEDFYPSGPQINHLVPTAEWKGEDHGFWTLCMLAGLIPRLERRTNLVHIGRKAYGYDPEAGGAQ